MSILNLNKGLFQKLQTVFDIGFNGLLNGYFILNPVRIRTKPVLNCRCKLSFDPFCMWVCTNAFIFPLQKDAAPKHTNERNYK